MFCELLSPLFRCFDDQLVDYAIDGSVTMCFVFHLDENRCDEYFVFRVAVKNFGH